MNDTNTQLQAAFAEFLAEDAKFTGGNSAAGTRSLAATRLLRLAGVTEVYTVDGGYAAWHDAGLPLVYDVIPV